MKTLFAIALSLWTVSSFAQQTTQDDINRDVWYNFMQAYQDLDASLFNQIHTDDVIRVVIDQNMMFVGQEYKDRNLENFNRWNANNVKQKIEFSFYNRASKNGIAYETGIFKLTRYQGFESKSYYGKFHVTLKKIAGTWKIYIDSDTSESGTINEEDFLKGDELGF